MKIVRDKLSESYNMTFMALMSLMQCEYEASVLIMYVVYVVYYDILIPVYSIPMLELGGEHKFVLVHMNSKLGIS